MGTQNRYAVSDSSVYSESGVLKNELGFDDQQSLDDAETLLYQDAYEHFFELLHEEGLAFELSLLFQIHEFFLGTLYEWAGKPRQYDISKDGVTFASVRYMDNTISELKELVGTNMPSREDSVKATADKLALLHNEINAVHPFLEGNGRTLRLFLDLIVESLGYPRVIWKADDYMDACRAGIEGDNSPMSKIILRSIRVKKG